MTDPRSLCRLLDDQKLLISVDTGLKSSSSSKKKRRRKLSAKKVIATPPFHRVEGPTLTPFERPAELIGPNLSTLLDPDRADDVDVDYDADSDDATFAADTLHGMDVVELEKKIDLLNKAMPKSKAKARIVLKGCHNFKKIYFRWKRRNKPGKYFRKSRRPIRNEQNLKICLAKYLFL